MTLSINGLFATPNIKDTQHSYTAILLSVIMPNVIMLRVVIVKVIVLSVISNFTVSDAEA